MDDETIQGIIERIQAEEKIIKEFKESEGYYSVLNSWNEELKSKNSFQLDSTNHKTWSNDIELTFDLLRENALETHHFNTDTVVVKYDDIFITLSELHGQGCFQFINVSKELQEDFVDFDDLKKYMSSGIKPTKYYVLDIIEKGLNAVEAIQGSTIIIDSQEVQLDDVWSYLLKNLT